MRHRKVHGWTLIELMTVVVVIAALAAIALPSYTGAAGRAETRKLVTTLVNSVATARGAAQNYETDTLLCPSRDGASCSGSVEWHHGWIVGVDRDADNNIAGGEPVIEYQKDFDVSARMVTTAGRTRLQFQPYGSNAGSNVTFTLCDRRGAAGASAYVLNNGGNFHEARASPANVSAACAGL